jgi:hypothetical protein
MWVSCNLGQDYCRLGISIHSNTNILDGLLKGFENTITFLWYGAELFLRQIKKIKCVLPGNTCSINKVALLYIRHGQSAAHQTFFCGP